MIFKEALPFIEAYVDELNNELSKVGEATKLSNAQKNWLKFSLMGLLITNHICWAKFERMGLGSYTKQSLCWIFKKAKISWNNLIRASVILLFKKYGIKSGVLVIDETDKKRSKITTAIFNAYKVFDKKTGGYFNGQTLVILFLVTSKISIPVGFKFYKPDPALKEWKKKDDQLKVDGIAKKDRPEEPARNPNYPSKEELAISLLREFNIDYPDFKVDAILGDALYGTKHFFYSVNGIFPNTQLISQARSNQKVVLKNGKIISIETYFKRNPGVKQILSIRGEEPIEVTVHGARLHLEAHGKKRFIIALKYEGEDEYRYILASDLSWRLKDIVESYSLRWLIEVFFQDWKEHEGWGSAIKLQSDDGSSRGLVLSLLFDHCLLLHRSQIALVENNLPASTVGSLIEKTRVEAMICFIKNILLSNDPLEMLKGIEEKIENLFQLMPSGKHMNTRILSKKEGSPALKYRHSRNQDGSKIAA